MCFHWFSVENIQSIKIRNLFFSVHRSTATPVMSKFYSWCFVRAKQDFSWLFNVYISKTWLSKFCNAEHKISHEFKKHLFSIRCSICSMIISIIFIHQLQSSSSFVKAAKPLCESNFIYLTMLKKNVSCYLTWLFFLNLKKYMFHLHTSVKCFILFAVIDTRCQKC